MLRNDLSAECHVRHRDGSCVYPASLEGGHLLIHYGTLKHPRTLAVEFPHHWLLVRGSDADLAARRAAGTAIGDGRTKGENP